MDTVENLLLTIVKNIVEFPDDVSITATESEDERGAVTMLRVRVNKMDVGRCIGEEGRNAEAIRKVIALVGWKQLGKRVHTRIDVPKRHFAYEQ
jgi:hypothetical protein